MPQGAALYRRLTVAENLRLFARLEGVDDVDGGGRADARPDRARRPRATTRSGRSRAATSSGSTSRSACSSAPAVLLLDEPSTGLDPRQRERLWEFVLGLAGDRDDGDLLDPPPARRPSATATGCSSSPTASGVFDGTSARAPRRRPGLRGRATSRPPSSASCASGATEALMRWLLLKDLQILRRSPLIVGAADRLPGRARGADRLRALGRQLQAPGRLPERGPAEDTEQFAIGGGRRARSTRASPATGSARGSSASTSPRARRPSRRSRTAT